VRLATRGNVLGCQASRKQFQSRSPVVGSELPSEVVCVLISSNRVCTQLPSCRPSGNYLLTPGTNLKGTREGRETKVFSN
jgi:hypothetical protein